MNEGDVDKASTPAREEGGHRTASDQVPRRHRQEDVLQESREKRSFLELYFHFLVHFFVLYFCFYFFICLVVCVFMVFFVSYDIYKNNVKLELDLVLMNSLCGLLFTFNASFPYCGVF